MYNAANNASSRLAQAIGAADTSLTVLDGSSFPDAPFVVSIEDEIIEVGAKDGNTFSALVRGLEGTAPAAHASGSRVENRFTAGTYQQIVDKINNLKAEEIEYTSEVTSFTPTQVAAALDALAGVRIVEMGSNENGEYVRWENGLQICFVRGVVFSGDGTSDVKTGYWSHPAAFASPPAIVGRNSNSATSLVWYIEVNPETETGITNVFWRAYRQIGSWISGTDYYLHYIAIGRWK